MSKNVISQIEQQISGMTNAQRKVADFILHDTMEAAFSTIDQIAHATDVSTASVIRLANVLGYSTFSDFQKSLKEYLHTHSAPINRFSINTRDVLPDNIGNDQIADVYKNELENINATMQGLNYETIETISRKLNTAKNIYICGARTSESIARYLTYNFNRMFLNTRYVGDSPSELLNLFKHITQEDALIAVTLSRYNKHVCHVAKICREKGIPVIAMTDSYDAPLVPLSEYQLISQCKSNAFHNSIVSQIFLCDILIKVCSQIGRKRVRENLEKDEKIVAEMQYFMRK